MDNYAFSSSFGFGHINRLGAQDEPSNNIIYPHGKLMFIEPGMLADMLNFLETMQMFQSFHTLYGQMKYLLSSVNAHIAQKLAP